MSESILNALIHLFAIVANVNQEGISPKGKKIVKLYLSRFLNHELIDEYLSLFDNYYDFYQRELQGDEILSAPDARSMMTLQISNVCKQIKKGLLREERVIVFLQVLEFVFEDHHITEEEFLFIDTVAKSFSFSEEETKNFKSFIFEGTTENIEKDKVLIIDNKLTEWSDSLAWVMKDKTRQQSSNYKHIHRQNLYGHIIVLFIPSINSFVFRYIGELNIFLEGNKVLSGRSYFFKSGSIIKGPNIASIYYNEVASQFLQQMQKEKIILSGRNIEFTFRNSKNGIKKFNFSEESGQLVGIMGGSGVGKSTLLNLLNGKLPLHGGRIFVNGYDIHKNKNAIRGAIGYVPQDDLLIEELSVHQNLYYNAKLCFDDYTEEELNKRVEQVLFDFDLIEIKDLKVGNPLNKFISGGQRKRLNIALELMREPSILFIDEPTSGLSSMDSEKVINLLKEQALKGKLVIANIHQPSSDIFKLFDKLWILDKGGHPVYQGNPIDAVVYFKTVTLQVNAAESECSQCGNINVDQILSIVEAKEIDEFGNRTRSRKVSPEDWYDKYLKNIESQVVVEPKANKLPQYDFKIPNFIRQFKVFSVRNLLSKLSNKQYMLINLLEAPLLALILGFFSKYVGEGGYYMGDNKNLPVYLFMAVVVAVFLGLTISAEEIIKDRKILERESFLNLSRFSYLNAKILFLFSLSAVQTFLYVLIGNAILEIDGMLFQYWIILFSAACMGNMIGLNISSGLDSVIAIYILIPLLLVPQLLLGGAMIRFDDLHHSITKRVYVPTIANIMPTRWAYEALAVEQFKNNEFEEHFFDIEQEISEKDYITGYLIPQLKNELDDAIEEYSDDPKSEELEDILGLIVNEFIFIAEKAEYEVWSTIHLLDQNGFDYDIAAEADAYLTFMRSHFIDMKRVANEKRDSLYSAMRDELGADGFIDFRKQHYNKKLADIVLNRNDLEMVYRANERYVQKKDPVFMKPLSNIGRAHFYAPVKIFAGIEIDTLFYNFILMWFGSAILYTTLLFDVLRKIIKYFEYLKYRD